MPRTRPSRLDASTVRLAEIIGRVEVASTTLSALLADFRVALVAWMDVAGVSPTVADDEAARVASALTDGEREILEGLLDLEAFSRKSRATADRLARKVFHTPDVERLKRPCAALARRGV